LQRKESSATENPCHQKTEQKSTLTAHRQNRTKLDTKQTPLCGVCVCVCACAYACMLLTAILVKHMEMEINPNCINDSARTAQ